MRFLPCQVLVPSLLALSLLACSSPSGGGGGFVAEAPGELTWPAEFDEIEGEWLGISFLETRLGLVEFEVRRGQGSATGGVPVEIEVEWGRWLVGSGKSRKNAKTVVLTGTFDPVLRTLTASAGRTAGLDAILDGGGITGDVVTGPQRYQRSQFVVMRRKRAERELIADAEEFAKGYGAKPKGGGSMPSIEELEAWAGQATTVASSPAGSRPRHVNAVQLLDDPVFVPVFGRTYDSFQARELAAMSQILVDAMRSGAVGRGSKLFSHGVGEVFTSGGHTTSETYLIELESRRVQARWRAGTVGMMEGLPADERSLCTIADVEQAWQANLALGLPGANWTGADVLSAQRERVALPALAAEVEALEVTDSRAGIIELHRWPQRRAKRLEVLSFLTRQELIDQVVALRDEGVERWLQAEAETFSGFGSGLAALEASTRWYRDTVRDLPFAQGTARWGTTLGQLAALREAAIDEAFDVLSTEIDGLTHVESYRQRMFPVPGDLDSPIGGDVAAVLDYRADELAVEALLVHFSERELEWMTAPGVVDVTRGKDATPNEDEVALSMLREYVAAGGRWTGPRSVRPPSLSIFGGALSIELDFGPGTIRDVRRVDGPPDRYSFLVSTSLDLPGLGSLPSTTRHQHTIVLTPDGWRCPEIETELQTKLDQVDAFFGGIKALSDG